MTTIALRAESTVLSRNEQDFLLRPVKGTTNPKYYLRSDGRSHHELRSPLQFSWHRGETSAACRVQWGGRSGGSTQVVCRVSAQLTPPPYADRPCEGSVTVSVDVSPSAGTSYRPVVPLSTSRASSGSGPSSSLLQTIPDDAGDQKTLTHRILSCCEGLLLKSGALDLEALCVVPSHWVWSLDVAVTVLDASGGNVLDASILACWAALRHYRQPQVQVVGKEPEPYAEDSTSLAPPPTVTILPSTTHEPAPLPLHFTPLTASLAILMVPLIEPSSTSGRTEGGQGTTSQSASARQQHMGGGQPRIPLFLVDPTASEESVQSGIVTVGMNVHGEVCWLDYGASLSSSSSSAPLELQPQQLRQACQLAGDCVPSLCNLLESSLTQAHEQAVQERLTQLQQQQQRQASGVSKPSHPTPPAPAVPFYAFDESPTAATELMNQDDSTNLGKKSEGTAQQQSVEEAYRQQALEYNQGHVTHYQEEKGNDKDVAAARQQRQQRHQQEQHANSLLRSMLQSVQGAAVTEAKVTPRPDKTTKNANTVDAMQVDRETASAIPSTEAATATTAAAAPGMQVDSDEEAATMQLESEFQSIKGRGQTSSSTADNRSNAAAAVRSERKAASSHQEGDDDGMVDDLAAAIKKKKKKSKKSKSK